ncbi:MAG TPA: hypothetical protein VJ724_05855 [Tahibacter sp.]|nr:hypothetical protein [Tahibacter sp.]
MSQIAEFRCVPETVVVELLSLASGPGGDDAARDAFADMQDDLGEDLLDLAWSGYVVIVLFEYLREKHGFDFERIDAHPLAQVLSADGYCAVVEPGEAAALAAKFDETPLDEAELRDFANDFSGTNERDAGKGLLDAARAFAAALARIPAGHVGVLGVG